jgi:hypothetical protein
MLYGELHEGSRPIERPQLRYKDICVRDMRAADIDLNTRECCADIRQFWRAAVSEEVKKAEITRNDHLADKRVRRQGQPL